MRRVAAAVFVLILAMVPAACGGGDSTSTVTADGGAEAGSVPGEATTPKPGPGEVSEQGQGSEASAQGSGASGKSSGQAARVRMVHAAPLKVSGGGSAQFRVKGGDNSVQEFGSEGEESELQAAAEVLHSFYVARLGEEWTKACSYLVAAEIQSIEQLTSGSPQLRGKGCAAALAALTKPTSSPSLQKAITMIDAGSLRGDGEQAFLIYHGPPGKAVYSMPMRQEGGEWKLGALSASVLSRG